MTKRRYEGLVAWITGAGSGIGKALALRLGEEGARVAVSGRRREVLEEVVGELRARGADARVVECDVTKESDLAAAVAETLAAWGRLDVAVANAGLAVNGRIEKLTAADWRRQLDTNVIGAALTIAHALPALRETKGRAALVGSVSALLSTPGSGAYSASKAAVRAIGETLSMELHGSGVSCTTLHPGFVESDIARVDARGVFDPSREDKRPKQLMWPADKAAKVCADAIWSRKRELVFTAHGKLGAFVGRHLPGVAQLAMTRGPAKKAAKNVVE